MKTSLTSRFLLGLLLTTLVLGCQEPEIILKPVHTPLQPASTDASAGQWLPVLPGAAPVVAAPASVVSAEYQAELAALKTQLANRTPEQTQTAEFWASGGVLRWNQLARQLVSKYNVPPVVGTPFDATNPFATPPYAARVYALLSVAQYDALIAVWKAKHQYNRPSLSRQGVAGLLPATDLPSYPSEDAAIAVASCEVLAFLFPREKALLTAKAAEHQQARLWAGGNVSSDLTAGSAIGKILADRTIAYARTDRMGAARDVNNTWKTLVGYDPAGSWTSLELPYRPPMLPLLGKVKTWYDSTAIFKFIPGPHPKLDSPEFKQDIADVRRISDRRTHEQQRITEFWSDGAGTATPPGHWNQIAEDLIRKNRFSEIRTARTLALLNRAQHDASVACWHTKYKYYLARPSVIDPKIKTSIGLPNFPSYTSGHSTYSSSSATLLGYLFPADAAQLKAWADEAGISRIYGGIHYHFDNTEGAKCGAGVGSIAVEWAKRDGAN